MQKGTNGTGKKGIQRVQLELEEGGRGVNWKLVKGIQRFNWR